MALNIQSVNYLSGVTDKNNSHNTNGQVQINVPSGLNSKEAGLALLANLKVGDTFTGEIINITQDEITLALSDQVKISAQLADALSYNIGDMATFSVKDNSKETIVLKSINTENIKNLMNDQTVQSALKSAGLVVDETNVSLVHNMMKQGISIDSNTLGDYAGRLGMAVNATPEDIVILSKMGIEINDTNITALHNYYNFNDGIMEQGSKLMESFSSVVVDTVVSNEFTQADVAEFILDYTSSFTENVTDGVQLQNENLSQSIPSEQLTELAENILRLESDIEPATTATQPLPEDENTPVPLSKDSVADTTTVQAETVKNSPAFTELATKVMDGSITSKEFLTEFSKLLNNEIVSRDTLEKLVKSDSFKAVSNNFTAAQIYIPPEEFNKENLSRMYSKILRDSDSLIQKLGGDGRFSGITSAANQMSQNIDLMNNINQFMSFVQVPLKLAGQNTHGDLYVYSKKGRGREESDDLKALLHLDMDNLGPLDVLVTLNKMKVTTDFKVESVEVLDFIEAHMNELTMALNRHGYKTELSASLNTTPYSFKQSVVENELPPVEIKRFSFDVRA